MQNRRQAAYGHKEAEEAKQKYPFRAEPRRAVCLLQAESCPGEGVGELVTGVNSLCNDPASFPAIQVGEEAAPLLTRFAAKCGRSRLALKPEPIASLCCL
jgi:hypothetical protein